MASEVAAVGAGWGAAVSPGSGTGGASGSRAGGVGCVAGDAAGWGGTRGARGLMPASGLRGPIAAQSWVAAEAVCSSVAPPIAAAGSPVGLPFGFPSTSYVMTTTGGFYRAAWQNQAHDGFGGTQMAEATEVFDHASGCQVTGGADARTPRHALPNTRTEDVTPCGFIARPPRHSDTCTLEHRDEDSAAAPFYPPAPAHIATCLVGVLAVMELTMEASSLHSPGGGSVNNGAGRGDCRSVDWPSLP